MAFKSAKIYGKFYSPERALSYGRPWIFVLGSRSVGKSTGWSIWALRRYLMAGLKFMYVRRTDDEVMLTCRDFFDDAVQILRNFGFDIADFKYERTKYFIKIHEEDNFVECGCVLGLSQEQKAKSSKFGDYGTIIYDEFISRDPHRYLGSRATPLYEYDCCISLYQTVDRRIGQAYRNETIFIFLGNKSSYYTPVFMALGIDEFIRTDSRFIAPKGKLWVVEQIDEVEATEDIERSFSYQLSDDKTRDYAYLNQAVDQNQNFVEKITKPMQAVGNFKFSGTVYGVYMIPDDGVLYVSTHKNSLGTLALTCGDHDSINYLLAPVYRDSWMMQALRDCFIRGQVRFETQKCKYAVTNYFMLVP